MVAISFSRDLFNPGIKPVSLIPPVLAGRFFCVTGTYRVPNTYWVLKVYFLNEYIYWMNVFGATCYSKRVCYSLGEEKQNRRWADKTPERNTFKTCCPNTLTGDPSDLLQAWSALWSSEGHRFLMLQAISVWSP